MTRVSIITPTYNSAQHISGCLSSVRNQSITAEHIIIDGLSRDNTCQIVEDFASGSTILFSEKDKSLYDAINKGIQIATGEIIGVLNSDDIYASPSVLENVAKVFDDTHCDCCYADLDYIDDRGKVVRRWKSGKFTKKKFYWGWMPPHPTFFLRKRLYMQHGLYRLDLGTSADYELMLRYFLKYEVSAHYIQEVLVKMRLGGVSNASTINRINANRMDRKAWHVNGITPHPWTISMKPIRKIPQFLRRS